jgi:hypothetical protein
MKILRRFNLIVAWYDCWVGLFYDRRSRALFVFPVPMIGVRIDLSPSAYLDKLDYTREIDEKVKAAEKRLRAARPPDFPPVSME